MKVHVRVAAAAVALAHTLGRVIGRVHEYDLQDQRVCTRGYSWRL